MQFDMKTIPARQAYNLLIGLVVPRPIALVTSHDLQGRLNAAPFSSYNYLSTDPPILGLGIASRPGPGVVAKDTAKNILDTKEYVVNVVTEDIAEKMNICAIDFPHEIDELEVAGLETEASSTIAVPRIKGIRAAFECRHVTTLQIGKSHIVLGEVLSIFVEDKYVDKTGPFILTEEMHQIGRAGGLGSYVKTRNSFFTIARIKYEDWLKNRK